MDEHVARFPFVADADLHLALENGVAYQADLRVTASYDRAYYDRCAGFEGTRIGDAINAARVRFVNSHVGPARAVLDVGAGAGTFALSRPNTWGWDVNPWAVQRLLRADRFASECWKFDTFTMWDVIEHLPRPADYLDRLSLGDALFLSVPIFADLRAVRASHHYRPGEHLYYWTDPGLVSWLALHGFDLVARSDHEERAGRRQVGAYLFRRARLPGKMLEKWEGAP